MNPFHIIAHAHEGVRLTVEKLICARTAYGVPARLEYSLSRREFARGKLELETRGSKLETRDSRLEARFAIRESESAGIYSEVRADEQSELCFEPLEP
eukprot:scaffold8382_cov26-Tisochrysis_lutea.AAC.1